MPNMSYRDVVSFLWVTEWERAVRFYTEILGFSRAYESDGWAELSVPGTKNAYLALNRWARSTEPPKNEFITLRVLDLDAYRSHLLRYNVRMKGDIQSFEDEGQGMRMFKFFDPDGNVLTASAVEAGR